MANDTLVALCAQSVKRFGEGRVMTGLAPLRDMRRNVWDFPRLMTGVFPLDYCMGGGVPMNVPIQFYGPPDSLKSTTAYLTARSLSGTCMNTDCMKPLALCKCEKPLIQKTMLCQFEGNSLDDTWFMTLGYDADEHMVVAFPDYAEQGCEIIEAAVRSDDCGLVIVDSIGSMIPRAELEGSYEDTFIGNQSRLLTRFIKRLSNILVGELRRGHFVSVILINQVRSNIGGGLFSPSESTAGGYALRHGVRMSVRFSQLSLQVAGEKTHEGMKNLLRASASLISPSSKQQMLILEGKCEFKLIVRDYLDYRVGSVLDFKTVMEKAKEFDMLKGSSTSQYTIDGAELFSCRLQKEIEEPFKTWEGGYADAIRYAVLSVARKNAFVKIQESGSRVLLAAKLRAQEALEDH